MLIELNKRRGQTTLEYAVLIIIIVGALFTIQVYIKRGLQGRMKSAADDIGDQFSPGNTEVEIRNSSNSATRDSFGKIDSESGVGSAIDGSDIGVSISKIRENAGAGANRNLTKSKSLVGYKDGDATSTGNQEFWGSKENLKGGYDSQAYCDSPSGDVTKCAPEWAREDTGKTLLDDDIIPEPTFK